MSTSPRLYDAALYEEQLSQAGGSFPVSPVEPELAMSLPDGPLPRPAEPDELSDEERLSLETAWHHLADPNKPLSHRHREVCRLLAKGQSHVRISELLGYTQAYISMLSCHEKLRKFVSELQDRTFQMTINDRMTGLNHKAFDRVEEMITSEDRDIKLEKRFEAAKWLLEKTTGKAKQEIETKDGNLTDFMTLLRQMKEQQPAAGEPRNTMSLPAGDPRETIDVTPKQDSLETWVERET